MPDTPEMRRDIAAFKAGDLRHRVAHAPALEATRSELEEVAVQMRERLLTWMIDTDDPLLDGPVEPPPGAEYNEQDQISAGEPTRVTPRRVPAPDA